MTKRIVIVAGENLDFCLLDKERHLQDCLEWINTPSVNQYLSNIYNAVSEKDEEDWFNSLSSSDANNMVFALETKAKKFNGTIGIHEINWTSRLAELGIMIGAQDEWGKGHATEAEKMMLNYAFLALNLRKIVALIYKDNQASLRAAQKAGFQVEGGQKDHYFSQGKYHDLILLAYFNPNL